MLVCVRFLGFGKNQKNEKEIFWREKTMTKKDLVAKMAELAGSTPKEAGKFYDAFTAAVEEILLTGERIQLSGFGNFDVKVKPPRDGINPATGEKIKIARSRAPVFRAAKQLKDKFNA